MTAARTPFVGWEEKLRILAERARSIDDERTYRFSHEIIRETISRELTLAKRVAIDEQCARQLERLHTHGDAEAAARIHEMLAETYHVLGDYPRQLTETERIREVLGDSASGLATRIGVTTRRSTLGSRKRVLP